MARRFLFRALIPAAALALTGTIGLTPGGASTATWQINSVIGDPAGQTLLNSVAASGPDNAWVTGAGCTDSSCASQGAIIQRWNGQSWQPFDLPDSSIFGFGFGVVVSTSSASNTWIFGADPNNVGYGVHVTDSAVTQVTMPAAEGGLSFTGAAVFSPGDAWAFGITGDFNNAIFSSYAAHYDGQTWTELPTPPVVADSVSALSSDDLWILGQENFATASFAMARWTGSSWAVVPVPDATALKLPAATIFTPISILADSPDDVWVTAGINTTCPPCGFGSGVLLLHWNANGWHSSGRARRLLGLRIPSQLRYSRHVPLPERPLDKPAGADTGRRHAQCGRPRRGSRHTLALERDNALQLHAGRNGNQPGSHRPVRPVSRPDQTPQTTGAGLTPE